MKGRKGFIYRKDGIQRESLIVCHGLEKFKGKIVGDPDVSTVLDVNYLLEFDTKPTKLKYRYL